MMKREYDFSTAVRGKFFRRGAVLQCPIYLDAKVQDQIELIARKKRTTVGKVVNQLVKKEVKLLEGLVGPTGRK